MSVDGFTQSEIDSYFGHADEPLPVRSGVSAPPRDPITGIGTHTPQAPVTDGYSARGLLGEIQSGIKLKRAPLEKTLEKKPKELSPWEQIQDHLSNGTFKLKKVDKDEIAIQNMAKHRGAVSGFSGDAVNKILARKATLMAPSSDSESEGEWD